jgi:UDP-N-acetylmuramate dehydrogenase
MKERLQQICDGYGCVLKTDVPLSRYTTFRIGGTADYWAEVNSISCLRELLSFCRSESVPYFVLGRGSNILASDEGYRGVILHLGSAFADVEVFGSEMTCQAGAILGNVARTAASLGRYPRYGGRCALYERRCLRQ